MDAQAPSLFSFTSPYFLGNIEISFVGHYIESFHTIPFTSGESKAVGENLVEVTKEHIDAEAISEGKLEEAIKHLTTTLLLIMHATRVERHPCYDIEVIDTTTAREGSAVRDANAALEINPEYVKGYKSRGIAQAMLGQWKEAAEAAVKVEPIAHKLDEHDMKCDRHRKEREEKKAVCEMLR